MSSSQQSDDGHGNATKKLRLACDACHYAKTKCCGSRPCTGCSRSGNTCIYSQSNRVGRPKGTRNKRSLDLSMDPPQKKKANGDKTTRRANTTEDYRHDVGRDTVTLPSSLANDITEDQHSAMQQQKNSMSYAFGVENSYLEYPNMFVGQTVGDHNIPFEFMTANGTLESTDYTFPANPGFGVQQGGIGYDSTIGMGTLSGFDLFSQYKIPENYFLESGQGLGSSIDFNVINTNNDSSNYGLACTSSANSLSSANSSPQLIRAKSRTQLSEAPLQTANTSPQSAKTAPKRQLVDKSANNSPHLSRTSSRTQPNTPELFIPDTDSASYSSSPLQTPTSHPPADATKCLCLQYHAKLLVRLKDLWKGSAPAPIDVVLSGVQQALVPWNHYIQCRICQLDEDQEVLVLSAMSIRAVLRLLKSAYPTEPTRPNGLKRGCLQAKRRRVEAPDGTKFAFGSYEITGEERMLVLEVLLSKTLDKIQFVLCCLKKRSSRQSSLAPLAVSHGSSSNEYNDGTRPDHVQGLLQGLESTVQLLVTDLAHLPMRIKNSDRWDAATGMPFTQ